VLGHKPRGFWFDPESEVSSVGGDAPGTIGGWMTVLMKSWGRLTGLSSIFAFIFISLSQRKKNKILVFNFGLISGDISRPFCFYFYLIIIYKYFMDL
jgi:hypothetical protein